LGQSSRSDLQCFLRTYGFEDYSVHGGGGGVVVFFIYSNRKVFILSTERSLFASVA